MDESLEQHGDSSSPQAYLGVLIARKAGVFAASALDRPHCASGYMKNCSETIFPSFTW
jgi:hypothetical protein